MFVISRCSDYVGRLKRPKPFQIMIHQNNLLASQSRTGEGKGVAVESVRGVGVGDVSSGSWRLCVK